MYFSDHVFNALAAGDYPYTWYFTSVTGFTLSDSTKIEVSESEEVAQLKLQQYLASDVDTAALYYLDENSGTTAYDATANNNDGTITGADYISTDYNYGLTFDGINDFVTVPDSTSLSVSGNNTVEARITPTNNYSAYSSYTDRGIVDSGAYKFYLDNETGKLVYEAASADEDSWTIEAGAISAIVGGGVGGSWDFNGKGSVSSIVETGGVVYVGLGNAISDSEVWKLESGSWTQIGGDGVSMDGGATYSWIDTVISTATEEVSALATDGTYVYAGLGSTSGMNDGEVWQYTIATGAWVQIGGDGMGWGGAAPNAGPYEQVLALKVISGELYAGLGNTADDGELWRYSGGSWAKLGGDDVGSPAGWTNAANIEQVYSIAYDASYVYVGLGNNSAADSQVWRCALPACSGWTQIGGQGAAGGYNSWTSVTGFERVTTLITNGEYLYAGFGTSDGDAEIWRFNTSTETWGGVKWAGDGTGWGTAYNEVNDITFNGTTVYAGLGNTAGENEVWMYDGSWSQIGGLSAVDDFGILHTNVRSLLYANGTLYAGLQHTSSTYTGELWTYNGATWTLMGGNYVNKSWGYRGLNSVEVMATANDKLYVGTGYAANGIYGNALVFEYDGTNWSVIGGQGINNGWSRTDPGPYEIVSSMANLGGKIYVGLGSTVGDAEVWGWEVDTPDQWTKIGGDGVNSGWDPVGQVQHEYVSALAVHLCSGSTTNYCLFAGLGNGNTSGNYDGEVWQFDPNAGSWTQIAGTNDATNWGQTTRFEIVQNLVVFRNKLIAGLGVSAGDAEVWEWAGTGTDWTIIGGNNGSTNVNSSWDPPGDITHEAIASMAVYDNELYAGLGNSPGDGELWKFNGSSWEIVGGDGTGYPELSYEAVQSLGVYNGELLVGLGLSAGDGEIHSYNGTTWTHLAGDGENASWPLVQNVERVNVMANYKGKIYVGTGLTANSDAMVWSYGDNIYATSDTSSFTGGQSYHVAATYNGSLVKIFIDGVEDSSTSVSSIELLDSSTPLLIGSLHGSSGTAQNMGKFNGVIDEVRISSTARQVGDFILELYPEDPQTIYNTSAQLTEDVASWAGFETTSDADGGSITYRLSTNGGSGWKYWNSGSSIWDTSDSLSLSNTEADIDTNISDLEVTEDGIIVQAILEGDGTQRPNITSITVESNSDALNPDPVGEITAKNSAIGAVDLTSGNWYNYTGPKFSWEEPLDNGDSGIMGYYVYFGEDDEATPSGVEDTYQTERYYIPTGLVSGHTYHLRIQTKDNAQNVSAVSEESDFIYKFDDTPPSNPTLISVSPSGYSSSDHFTFSWPSSGGGIATDAASQIQGFKYRTGGGTYETLSSIITDFSVTLDDASYPAENNANVFYLRAVDNANNEATTEIQINYYFAGDGPSAPRYLTVTDTYSTTNSFGFSWQPPETYSGELSEMTYCYTIEATPTEESCTFTSAGATSLAAGPFAVKTGINTFYLVAKNSSNAGGAISYANVTSVSFEADTAAPGIPRSIEISDVSIKNQSAWRLALSWAEPLDDGSGIDHYRIYRSETGNNDYTVINDDVTGSAYIDPSLEQITYYYKVDACDNVNNCGATSEVVSLLPTGRFTTAAELESDPEVTAITTKRATISWSTDRTSDSKIQYGKTSDDYFDEEPSNSTQVTSHEINLSNLSPGTRYYALAKWTDEDGNTGTSDEFTFQTSPAPTVTDPSVKVQGIDSVTLQYTIEGAAKVRIYYGLTSSFGGSVELSTSADETTYLTKIEDLQDGIKYYYKINTFDEEDDEYEGNILTFETIARPKVTGVKVQQILGTAQPAVLITWTTNTETSTVASYYPVGEPAGALDEVNANYVTGLHKLIIKNLSAESRYNMIIKATDKSGNQAHSDIIAFTTTTDTRPAVLSDISIEANILETQENNPTAQLNISWNSDESATSQVEYGEGTGSNYPQKTQEDKSLTLNHLVVINGLTPSKVYHIRVISKDKSGNESKSVDYITITPKAADNALDLVISNLQRVFGAII